jgi:DNA helicase HerA-like ATPase
VAEILEMSDAQQDRFFVAYEIAKALLRELDIFPAHGDREQERIAAELDQFDRGYSRLTLQCLLDVVAECLAKVAKSTAEARSPEFSTEQGQQLLRRLVQQADLPGSAISWKALLGKLGRLSRIRVFDPPTGAKPIYYGDMLRPGVVSIVDLSESGASALNNIVIADLLKGLQDTQDELFEEYEAGQREGWNANPPTPVLVIIEEAHEFLSAERISAMPTLFEHLARMAKRGRKRWLGLVFVTQLPQHLPSQIFGLVNSYVLHKITDPQVVNTLKRTVSGIDNALWQQLPGLAPGQAIVSFPHMARPLLVAVDPTPAKLRLVD